jgi:hypothetical protein
MKLILYFKIASHTDIEKIRKLNTEEFINYMDKKNQEHQTNQKLLESFGFTESWNEVAFGDKRFNDLLRGIQNKFTLNISIFIKLTQKEMKEIQAFKLSPISILPMKHDIAYSSSLSVQEPCPYEDSKVYLREDDFKIAIHKKGGIIGKYKFKNHYFKVTESSSVPLIATAYIRKIIEDNKLSGFDFTPLQRYMQKTKSSVPIEDVYYVTPKSLMQETFLDTNLTIMIQNQYENEDECSFFNQTGPFIYNKGAFDLMPDFTLFNPATCCEGSDLLVSKKFREVYMSNKLKGLKFDPILEKDTILFEQYNELIQNFARLLVDNNPNHSIGHEKIDPANLVNGVL